MGYKGRRLAEEKPLFLETTLPDLGSHSLFLFFSLTPRPILMVDRRSVDPFTRAGQGRRGHLTLSPVKRATAHTPEPDCPRIHPFLISCPALLSLSFPELLIPFDLFFFSFSISLLRRRLQVCFCFFQAGFLPVALVNLELAL